MDSAMLMRRGTLCCLRRAGLEPAGQDRMCESTRGHSDDRTAREQVDDHPMREQRMHFRRLFHGRQHDRCAARVHHECRELDVDGTASSNVQVLCDTARAFVCQVVFSPAEHAHAAVVVLVFVRCHVRTLDERGFRPIGIDHLLDDLGRSGEYDEVEEEDGEPAPCTQ